MEQKLKDAVVDAGCLLFFSDDQDVAGKADVLDALLYIQLAASKQSPKFVADSRWSDIWREAALDFGWALKASERISAPLPHGNAQTLWSLASHLAETSVSPAMSSVAQSWSRTICAQVPVHEAMVLLARETLHREAALADMATPVTDDHCLKTVVSLQIGFVRADRNVALTQIRLVTRQSLTSGFLFDTLDPDLMEGNVALTFYSLQLVEQLYTPFRSAFDQALAHRRGALLKSFGETPHVR
ncbi:hypothetical protein BZK31_16095 [Pseudomonas floridensis]|uniref:Uncharacterized protein n=1 Tax=Pseudomonas floridensis TaxID=1958950 RepID=A0A1X0N4C9_9PSED|nr:hypothetical protein [Pseudomonas floridensis]ORC58235.1 hypothetical protein BZK31_16095 [Pseudomonas floridensis]